MTEEHVEATATTRRAGLGVVLVAWAAHGFIRLLRATVRIRFHDESLIRSYERDGRRFILAFWHRHMLLMRYAYRGSKMTVLSSRSRDGELMARVLGRFGIDTSRGSTTRGGAMAMRGLLRRARAGSDLGFTPDGPRGPACKVQPGVIHAAAATGMPIIPVALAATRFRQLPGWDRMLVPLPGARVDVVYGEPLALPRDATPEEWGPRLEAAIEKVGIRARGIARVEESV